MKPESSGKAFFRRMLEPDNFIFIVVLFAFIERAAMFFYLGSGTASNSDDAAYIQSGIVFAKTGVISVWSEYPTAKIMPGMPVLCGVFSLIFGEGALYIDAMRWFWILMGCASVYVFYRCCCVIMPKQYGIFAALSFLLPNWAWSDDCILTEAPYLLFYLLTLYFTLRAGEDDRAKPKILAGYIVSFMLALMFRPNILTMPFFTALYLIVFKKRPWKSLLKSALCLAAALLVFVIPWSVRNYRVFGEFIPITNGAANPTLLGTYQGEGAPADDELDYETNVYSVIRERYPEYYDENGELKDPANGEKMSEKIDALKAEYRLKEWFRRDPLGLLYAYLISKPACMLNWVWCWLPNPSLYYALEFISKLNFAFCVLSFVLAFAMKRSRRTMLFLALTYWVNIYIIALSFASERYSAMFMPYRYMICALGLYLTVKLIKSKKARRGRA